MDTSEPAYVQPSLGAIEEEFVVSYSLPNEWLHTISLQTTTSVNFRFKEDFATEKVPTFLDKYKCKYNLVVG